MERSIPINTAGVTMGIAALHPSYDSRYFVFRSLNVIASAAKQSILSFGREMDCFAALAMTADGPEQAFSRHDLREALDLYLA